MVRDVSANLSTCCVRHCHRQPSLRVIAALPAAFVLVGVAECPRSRAATLHWTTARADKELVVYFFRRGESRVTLETRLNPAGLDYELVVTMDGATHIEGFQEMPALLSREHELVQAWRAMGWREGVAPTRVATPRPPDEDWFDRRR